MIKIMLLFLLGCRVNNSSIRPVNKTFLRETSSRIERGTRVLAGADLRVKRIIFGANAATGNLINLLLLPPPSRSIRRYSRSRRRQGPASLVAAANY